MAADKMLAHCRCGDGRANLLQAGLRKVPMDSGRDRGFGASRGTRQKNNAPDRPAENAMVAFSAAMADASAMRGWSPEPVTSWTMKGPYGRWS